MLKFNKIKLFSAKNQAKCTVLGWPGWWPFFPNTIFAWSRNFSISFLSSSICTLCGCFSSMSNVLHVLHQMIHLRNDEGGASKVEEEEVMPTMVSMLVKKKKLLVLDVNGLLVATYHKQEALPPKLHHMKFDNFYNNILLFLFFSIVVVFFSLFCGRTYAFGSFTIVCCFLLWLFRS